MSYRLASWALERMAEQLGVPLSKALDPLDPDDFITISARLAASLRGATRGTEAAALKAAIDKLDVNWKKLTAAQRSRIVDASRAEIGKAVSAAKEAEKVLEGSRIVPATRASAVRRFGLEIRPEPAAGDKVTARLLRSSQMVYIKDEYGQRADAWDKRARSIVASGIERGLGPDDISGELSTKLSEYQISRSKEYWNLIANDFANKSRTATQINAFDEAGIETYTWVAVGDEVTCPVCRMMDGKTWSVRVVKAQLEEALVLEDAEFIKDARPWIREGVENGKNILYFDQEGERRRVADVSTDGKIRQRMSDRDMLDAGVTLPPIHGRDRCTIVVG